MTKLIDITGQKFGRLTVLKYISYPKWLCLCDCGKDKIIRGNDLKSGKTQSCGCLRIDKNIEFKSKNRKNDIRFYKIWCNMKQRCLNPNIEAYKDYGGRGIIICNEWLNSFDMFKKDMYFSYIEHIKMFGEKNTFIDRKDNNKGYNTSNCRWATRTEQNNNQRVKKNRIIQIEETGK